MKKKILSVLVLLSLFVLVGCDNLMNTPTKKVEEFLNKYQTTNSVVLNQLDYTLDSEYTLSDTQKEAYRTIMKRQYQNLTYTIKDETVDGDSAVVKAEIEVYDYNKAMKTSDSYLLANQSEFLTTEGTVDTAKFMDYKIEQMKKATDKVKYTIEFTLTKKDKEWKLDDVTEIDRQKIHGIYSY